MKTTTKIAPVVLVGIVLNQACYGQTECNQMAADRGIKQLLIKEICIPADKVIGDITNNIDLNMDGRKDVIVRYHKMPLSDGDIITHDIYTRIDDSDFKLYKSLETLMPPYLNSYSSDYAKESSLAQDIYNRYPRNVYVEFKDNQIIISHFLYDVYGKTYIFEYSKNANDWVLSKEQYWIGELSRNYIALMGVSEKLRDRVFLEEKKQVKPIKSGNFSLKDSKAKAEEEGEYLMEKYDIFNWKVD